MDWRVERHDGTVVRVVVTCGGRVHRLQGHDRYWIAPPYFGQFNVDIGQYRGRQRVAYRCADDGIERVDVDPPDGAHVWEGGWVPDGDAARLGLL